jgi:TIR domain-containing protein
LPATEILPDTPPVHFVAELHRRWIAEQGAVLKGGRESRAEAVPPAAMFFISYSRKTDLPAAEAVADALLKLGLTRNEVWFDRTAIEPGQQFCDRILDGIRGCRYFLPLLSKAANDRDKGFFFREWRAANDHQKDLNYEFRIPIILDVDYHPESYTAEPVREWRNLDFGHAPNGVPDERTADKLQKLVRTTRLPGGRDAD